MAAQSWCLVTLLEEDNPKRTRKMKIFVNFAFLLLVALQIGSRAEVPLDQGYEIMFTSYPENIPRICVPLGASAALGLSGSFILPSVAQFELNGAEFVSVLDGFGKLHKFEFTDGQMCFQSKMIGSGFYNESMSAQPPKIAPGILFMDTSPPLGYRKLQKIMGPNDNVYVNTVAVGDHFLSLTDSQYMLDIDFDSLAVEGLVKFSDSLDKNKLSTGSAHGVTNKRGCFVNIDPQSNMDGTYAKVLLYELCPSLNHDSSSSSAASKRGPKFVRHELNSYNTSNGYVPYMHSFGLTENLAILPHQSFYFDYEKVWLKHVNFSIPDTGIMNHNQ